MCRIPPGRSGSRLCGLCVRLMSERIMVRPIYQTSIGIAVQYFPYLCVTVTSECSHGYEVSVTEGKSRVFIMCEGDVRLNHGESNHGSIYCRPYMPSFPGQHIALISVLKPSLRRFENIRKSLRRMQY